MISLPSAYRGGSIAGFLLACAATTYGWGVTNAPQAGYLHTAYVTTTLTSPHGRSTSSGWRYATYSVRVDVYLGWDANDLGNYLVSTFHAFYCYAGMIMIYLPGSSATALLRLTKWAALRYDNTTTDICGYKIRTRTYQGLDEYGWIPKNEYWKLNEALTFKDESCGTIGIDGTSYEVGFGDEIKIGCSNPTTCVFETNQTFSVAFDPTKPLTQVPGKNCVGLSDTQCLAQSQHTGGHVRATATAITVTDN